MKNNNRGYGDAGVFILGTIIFVVLLVAFAVKSIDGWRVATYYTAGSMTASGEPYDPTAMTCADPTAEFGTWLRIETRNVKPSKIIFVRVNDRPPTKESDGKNPDGRLDLTPAAFKQLAPLALGKIEVTRKEVK